MNLNDFVVLPNNKVKSVKLSTRNLQELQMETVALGEESKEMEEKLLQLKEIMAKEKKERVLSGGFRWKSGQCSSLNVDMIKNNTKVRESRLQKVSAGKVKIQVLKDDSLPAPPQPLPPIKASSTGLQTSKTNRLKGTVCGQCEVRTAGLMCAECTENYCIGCFAKFHQKGALKLHKMIPIKTDLHTHVSTPDVISSYQKRTDHSLYPCTFSNLIPSPNFKPHRSFTSRKYDQNPEQGTEDVTKPMLFHPDPSQAVVINQGEEKKLEMTEEEMHRKDKEEFPTCLLSGEYSEEESARSFQEALRQWRGEKTPVTGEPMSESTMWIPVRPVSATATQVDLTPDKGAEGQASGREVGRIPVMVDFKEYGLTYLDRLLLKKHRRTPVEHYHTPVGFTRDLKSLSNVHSEEETANSLTAQEEDFRHYYASLFAVSASRSGADHSDWITTPQPCLVIEVLDETDTHINGGFVDVQMTEDNKMVHSIQQNSSNGNQTTLTSAMSSKSKSSACPTAETPGTSKTSIKTPTSKSQKTNFSPTAHKSNTDHGSPHVLSSLSFPQFHAEIPKFSSSCSHSVPLVHEGSDSCLLPEQPQSYQLLPEPVSSMKLSQSLPRCLEFPAQSQQSWGAPESLLSAYQLQHPPSIVSTKPNPKWKPQESSPPVNTPSGLSVDTYSRYKSTSTYGNAPVSMSCISISGDHDSTLSHQDTQYIPLDVLNVIQNPPSAVKDELSLDSGDETSSESLGLAPNEEDSSDDEPQMLRHITRGRSRGEEQGNPAISHLGDSFVPADAERAEDFQTDEPEQLSEPSMDACKQRTANPPRCCEMLSPAPEVSHSQSAGSGSELLCDLHEFTPLGLDMNSGDADTPGHTQSDPPHTCQTLLPDSNQTGSEAHGPGSSLSSYSKENLVFSMTKENQTQPTTSTNRGEMSANELGTSAFRSLSQAAQEIMEICDVDQTGCEDPDLDTDTTANTLRSLEQELRLLAKETGAKASVFGAGNSDSQGQRGSQHLNWGTVSEEQREEEEATQRDLQCVLLPS